MKIINKLILLLLAAIFPATAYAHDFEVDRIYYTITSDTTVAVTGNCLINWKWGDGGYSVCDLDIEIPRNVIYNCIDYTVTSIGDSAFFDSDLFCITIPETVKSIGNGAFKGDWWGGFLNVICLAKIPPVINDSFLALKVDLFVFEDAFLLYKEQYNQPNINIHKTNGERTELTSFLEDLTYPDDLYIAWYELTNEDYYDGPRAGAYGCTANFHSSENSIIYYRWIDYNINGWISGIEDWYTGDYVYYENDYLEIWPGFYIQAFAIEEGKSPSYPVCEDSGRDPGFYPKWEMSFDFKESGIAYNIFNHEISVTYSLYHNSLWGEIYCDYFIPVFYSGDVVIPSNATYHNYYDDSYTTYPVTSIETSAFSLNYYDNSLIELLEEYNFHSIENLTSVTLPSSIYSIGDYAFGDCPNLEFIKCLGTVPASASDDSFDEGVYQNTTLYVPMGAIDAYRNAEGWKNFQNIIEFVTYDFEVDGVCFTKINDNEVVVVHGENAYQGVINIPASVTYEGVTYDVTGIYGGTFADATLQSLVLPVTITDVGNNAFSGSHIGSLIISGNGNWTAGPLDCEADNLYVMSGVTGIEGLMVNPVTTVYSYSTLPPTCSDETFTSYDAELHVPASALAAYFTAPYWNYFINITSDAVEPTGITLSKDSVEVLVGNQLTVTATPVPGNATPANAVIWTSSNESIATVTDGIITAVHVGECDIKAYLLDKVAVCHVTVTEIAPTEITLNPEFAKLEIGSQLTLTATVLPEEATDKVVTWTTSNSAVATVDNMGTVTAVGQGECYITATCRDKQAICHIIVVDHFIFITLDEHELRLMPNHMAILEPSVMPENSPLVVTSSDPTVAAARMANGKIQVVGIKEGRTIIKINSPDGYAEADSCLVKVYTLRGDVNCDGFVNINDVTALINYLLSHNADGIDVINADANNDGNVNIADVTRLINHLLSGDELDPKEEPDEDGLTFTVNGVTFTVVAVEGGTFTMGATPEQLDDAYDAENPAHQVTLSGYAIGQTEVTQALWEAVTGNNPSRFAGRPDNPVEGVSWEDCQVFITQLNALTGKQFRLPTEAEWEFAARGGNNSQHYKYAGSNDIDEVAWYHDNAYGIGDNGTRAVGTKMANELGIYDMSGNVWEWCQDYNSDYTSEAQTDPTGPESGTNRMRRGGGWDQSTSSCRVSHRSNRAPNYKYNNLGLRLAL